MKLNIHIDWDGYFYWDKDDGDLAYFIELKDFNKSWWETIDPIGERFIRNFTESGPVSSPFKKGLFFRISRSLQTSSDPEGSGNSYASGERT